MSLQIQGLALLSVALWACSGDSSNSSPAQTAADASPATPTADANPATPTADANPATVTADEQIATGQRFYGEKCASCHGAGGEGTASAPPLVGLDRGALPLDPPASRKIRKTQFRTVADVAAFAASAMPLNAPGSLSEDQYWAILAFDLKANGIALSQPLDPTLAATLVIPR